MSGDDATRAKKRAQIKALMAKALHPETPPDEARACREKALELAARYSLDEALAEVRGAPWEKPVIEWFFLYPDDDAVTGAPAGAGLAAQARLLMQIARSLHCATVDWGDRYGWSVTVAGRPSDIAMVTMMWASLRLQAVSAAVSAPVPPGRSERHFRAGVMKGFAEEVAGRLRQPEEQGEPGAAVALRSRESEAWDFMRDYVDSLPDADGSETGRPASRHGYGSSEGISAGRAAGRAAHLGQKAAGGPGRKALP